MLSKEKFRDCFDDKIVPKLKRENIKVLIFRIIMLISLAVFMTFLIWAIVLLFQARYGVREYMFIPICSIVAICVLLIVSLEHSKSLRKLEKILIGETLATVLNGDRWLYESDRNLGKKELKESGFLTDDSCSISGEDYLEWDIKLKDKLISVKTSDVKVLKSYYNVNNDQFEKAVVDKGIFGIIDFGKPVVTEISGGRHIAKGLTKLELESAEFNKVFSCEVADQIEARKILTPRIMARLLKLQKEIGDRPRFHLVGNKLYFMSFKDLFAYKRKGAIDFGEAEQIYDQLYIIYQLATEIAKEDKVFKTE